jgi:hypothetical protein
VRRLVFVGVLGMILSTVSFGALHVSAATPTLTRLRLTLTEKAEYVSLTISGATIKAHHVLESSSGSTVGRGQDVVVLQGPNPATATVDVVFSVPEGLNPVLRVATSKGGEGRVHVTRTNAAPEVVADMYCGPTDSDGIVSRNVSRSLLVGEGLTIPRLDARRLVLAFYYPWFEAGTFSRGLWYDRPSSHYRTEDAAEVDAMVRQASGAGVSGFIVSWDGVGDHPRRFDLVLAAAQTKSFYAAPLIELMHFRTGSGFDVSAITASIRDALGRASNPAFLRVNGRPVMFLFGASQLGSSGWRTISAALRSAGHDPFVIGDSGDTAFALQGFYYYNPNGGSEADLSVEYNSAADAVRMAAQVNPTVSQRLWAATVSPGMNDTYIRPVSGQVQSRDGGSRYDLTWRAARGSSPEWILVTSWNEWYEATHVSPSQRFGAMALDQTRSWSSAFRNQAAATSSEGQSGLAKLLPLPLSGESIRYARP